MNYFTIGYRLPRFIAIPLFGDRTRFGLTIQYDDQSWQEWQKIVLKYYDSTQKQSVIGDTINKAGYRIMTHLALDGLRVLEIGPGDLNHFSIWKGLPQEFVMVDVQQIMLDRAVKKLSGTRVNYRSVVISRENQGALPFESNEFDLIISFYSLEHLYPLQSHLNNILRVLKIGGRLVGTILCEGGLAWGIGRYLTSRRWFLKNTNVNPDKIICWNHPNFADQILKTLDQQMNRKHLSFWSFKAFPIDINLIAKFIYEKR